MNLYRFTYQEDGVTRTKVFHSDHALQAFMGQNNVEGKVEVSNLSIIASEPGVPFYVHRNVLASIFDLDVPKTPYVMYHKFTIVGVPHMTPYITEIIRCLDDYLAHTERPTDLVVEDRCYNTAHMINNVRCKGRLHTCKSYRVTKELYHGPSMVDVYWLSPSTH